MSRWTFLAHANDRIANARWNRTQTALFLLERCDFYGRWFMPNKKKKCNFIEGRIFCEIRNFISAIDQLSLIHFANRSLANRLTSETTRVWNFGG